MESKGSKHGNLFRPGPMVTRARATFSQPTPGLHESFCWGLMGRTTWRGVLTQNSLKKYFKKTWPKKHLQNCLLPIVDLPMVDLPGNWKTFSPWPYQLLVESHFDVVPMVQWWPGGKARRDETWDSVGAWALLSFKIHVKTSDSCPTCSTMWCLLHFCLHVLCFRGIGFITCWDMWTPGWVRVTWKVAFSTLPGGAPPAEPPRPRQASGNLFVGTANGNFYWERGFFWCYTLNVCW